MKNICPNCYHKEPEEKLFCSKCGTRLVETGGLPTSPVPSNAETGTTTPNSSSPKTEPTPAANARISMHILSTGQILPLFGEDEFTLGRVSEDQAVLPDIDLTPYDAFNQGVSRLHAMVKLDKNAITITDLGSSNGTSVNGKSIPPNKKIPIEHGDLIKLGKFKFKALVQ